MKHIGLLCLVGMVVFSCAENKTEKETLPYSGQGDNIVVFSSAIANKLKAMVIEESPYQMTFSTTGVVKSIPTDCAEIASPFAERITKSFVRLGQKVVKGNPLFEISFTTAITSFALLYDRKERGGLRK